MTSVLIVNIVLCLIVFASVVGGLAKNTVLNPVRRAPSAAAARGFAGVPVPRHA